MGRKWRHQETFNQVINSTYEDALYVTVYDFDGRATGEIPQMFYRHLLHARRRGLNLNPVQKSVVECDARALDFIRRLLEQHRDVSIISYRIAEKEETHT